MTFLGSSDHFSLGSKWFWYPPPPLSNDRQCSKKWRCDQGVVVGQAGRYTNIYTQNENDGSKNGGATGGWSLDKAVFGQGGGVVRSAIAF